MTIDLLYNGKSTTVIRYKWHITFIFWFISWVIPVRVLIGFVFGILNSLGSESKPIGGLPGFRINIQRHTRTATIHAMILPDNSLLTKKRFLISWRNLCRTLSRLNIRFINTDFTHIHPKFASRRGFRLRSGFGWNTFNKMGIYAYAYEISDNGKYPKVLHP